MSHITVFDVARRCGLSPTTVSRVLNNTDYPVSEQARQKVLQASKELDYSPNPAGRMLKTKKNYDIGLIVPNISNYTYAILATGVQKVAAAYGYQVILCTSFDSVEMERKNIELLRKKQVAGIVLVTLDWTGDNIAYAVSKKLRIVAAEQAVQNVDCPRVLADHFHIPFMIMDYLVQMGHRDIAFLSAPLDRPSRKLLYSGYQEAGEKMKQVCRTQALFATLEPDAQGPSFQQHIAYGMELGQRLLQQSTMPTAIFCNNDMVALGALQKLITCGVRVPDDVSLVGIDNSPYSQLPYMPISSVDENVSKTGQEAAKMLFALIKGKEQENPERIIEATLVARGSVRDLR
ncbi:LacI family DNA-binding transcriptional regulator [Oscillospiraceae bacterium LTW-04]|nr:LacI family DNA-binding transcriptional regulator [Oscillospiraceae bacterium MB24-C1]